MLLTAAHNTQSALLLQSRLMTHCCRKVLECTDHTIRPIIPEFPSPQMKPRAISCPRRTLS